jgi:ring-1,2-phenylacetyl-CoA epoxidase subunit PaaC
MKDKILEFTTRLGDDSLVLGHRLSEWCRNAPFLEEELALINVSLDYIGRARMFYGYAAELAGDGRGEDDFAFMRDQREFSNLLIHELPKGDFAFTMLRQLFVDVFYSLFLPRLAESGDERLAAIAAKAIKETRYHLRRSHEWTLRFGLGTEESRERAQRAIDQLWGYTHEMFDLDALESELADAGIGVDNGALKAEWERRLIAILDEAELQLPDEEWAVRGGRAGYHTENLGHLLNEMQSVHRAYPGVEW